MKGGQTVNAEAPLDRIPLFIKAGSIVPMGPIVQYSGEKNTEPLEIRVFEGADGKFTLYDDEGDNYNYEKGKYATINFTWNDTKKTLTITDRNGSFPGMLVERKFNILLVSEKRGTGMDANDTSDKIVIYSGKELNIRL
jgi:alpha-D-xyloside xylohydrolase